MEVTPDEARQPLTDRARAASPKARATPTAFVFVGVVAAVVVVVALPAAGHAAVVLTAELVRLARPLGCTKDGQTLQDEKKQENEIWVHPGENATVSYRTPLWARPTRRRSRPRRRISSAQECSGRSLYSGTRPRRTSSGLQGGGDTGGDGDIRGVRTAREAKSGKAKSRSYCSWQARRSRPRSRCHGRRPRLEGCSAS